MPLSILTAGEILVALDEIAGVCATVGRGLHRPAVDTAGEVSVFSGADAVDRAAADWSALERAGGLTNPFQSLAVARAAARVHTARNEQVHVAIVHDGDQPAAILPVVVNHWCGVSTARFLGDPLIQYGDIIASPYAAPQHMTAAWRKLASMRIASFAHFRKVRADARIAPVLARDAQVVLHDEAPYVGLDAMRAPNARDARELRRFRRRLGDGGEMAFDVLWGTEAVPLLGQAIALKRSWLATRGLASRVLGDPEWEKALLDLAQQASGRIQLAAARLTVGDNPAAIEIGLVQDDRWFAFLGATAPQFAKAGPGQVQMAETMAYCRDNGIRIYDLLAPSQPYKRALATGAVAVSDYAIPLDLRGRVALTAARLAPNVRRMVARMPPAIRKLIFRQPEAPSTLGKS